MVVKLLDNGYDCKKQDNLSVQYVCTKDDLVAVLTHQPCTGRDYSSIEEALSLVNACNVTFLSGASWLPGPFLYPFSSAIKIPTTSPGKIGITQKGGKSFVVH